jgi:hypothetical protein
MNHLFDLYICRTEEECGKTYRAEYHVGTFLTEEEADGVMKAVMSEGGLFSAPDCEGRLCQAELVGEFSGREEVYRFMGYSPDGGLIVSPYYADKPAAVQAFRQAKKNTPGHGWHLGTYPIRK